MTAPRDDGSLWVALVCFAAALLAAANLLGGCAPQRVTCPGWAMPTRVDTDSSSTGSAAAVVSTSQLPPTIEAHGSGSATSSVDYSCKAGCPKGSLTKYSRTPQGETLECIPLREIQESARPHKPGSPGATPGPATTPVQP